MIEILEKVSEQVKKVENICSGSMPALDGEYYTPPVSQVKVNRVSKLSAPPNLPIFSGQEPVPAMEGSIDQWLFQVEGALATHTEEAVRSAVIGSVRGAAHELLEFIGYGEEMSNILKHIKERFGQGPSKAKLQKEFFLMEQRKTESINQFARQVEQRFKRLRALYPGRYDHGQLKERVFQGMHPHLRDSMRFLYMKEEVGYEEFLATVYEAETEGTEGKILSVKAKAMTVEKVVDKNEPTDLQDIKQQIESLATIMKSTTVGNVKLKEGEGVLSPKKKEVFQGSPKKAFQGSPQKGKGISKPGQKPIKCYRCDGWGHRWKECLTLENLKWRELVGAVVSSNLESTGSTPTPNPGHRQ